MFLKWIIPLIFLTVINITQKCCIRNLRLVEMICFFLLLLHKNQLHCLPEKKLTEKYFIAEAPNVDISSLWESKFKARKSTSNPPISWEKGKTILIYQKVEICISSTKHEASIGLSMVTENKYHVKSINSVGSLSGAWRLKTKKKNIKKDQKIQAHSYKGKYP